MRPTVFALAVAIAGGFAQAASSAPVPFEPPRIVDADLGVLRVEQTLRASVAAGGRVLLVTDRDVSTLDGYVPEQIAVRRADGSYGPLERVPPGSTIAGNAAGDAALAVVGNGRLVVSFLPRGEPVFRDPELVAEGVALPTSLGATPWVGDDGTVVIALTAPDGSIGVRIRRPDGTWEARDGLVPATTDPLGRPLVASVDPDGREPPEDAVPEAPAVRNLPLVASVDPDGTVSLVWIEWDRGARFGSADAQTVLYGRAAPGSALTREVVEAPPPLAPYAFRGGKPRFVALAAGGRALVASLTVTRSRNPQQEVVVNIREPDGTWLAPEGIARGPALFGSSLVETRQRVGVALAADGTAVVVANDFLVMSGFVRPVGSVRFGKPIPLQGLDTTNASGSPGVALGPDGRATAAWGAHFVPYGARTRWQLETSSFPTGPEALDGGAWPVELLGIGPVSLTRLGPCSGRNCSFRLRTSVRLRGAALLRMSVALCNPRCKDVTEQYVRGKDGANALSQRIVLFPPGRHRVKVGMAGPNHGGITRTRFFTVPS